MKCPKCGTDWPEGVKFCGTDGTALAQAVPDGLSPAQQKVNEQLRTFLPQIGLGRFVEVEPGHHICHHGSTHVQLQILNVGSGVAVHSMAPVTIGSRICPELMKFLLNQNARMAFGSFGLDPQGTIGFSHTILASSMDAAELGVSVSMVAKTADQFDDQIVAQWGGKTAKQTVLEQLVPAAIARLLK